MASAGVLFVFVMSTFNEEMERSLTGLVANLFRAYFQFGYSVISRAKTGFGAFTWRLIWSHAACLCCIGCAEHVRAGSDPDSVRPVRL